MAGLFGKVNRNKWNHWSVYYLLVWHVIIGYATCLCQGIIPFQDTLSVALWHDLNPIIPHASSSDYKAANDLSFAADEFKQQRNRQLEDFEMASQMKISVLHLLVAVLFLCEVIGQRSSSRRTYRRPGTWTRRYSSGTIRRKGIAAKSVHKFYSSEAFLMRCSQF